MRRIGANRQKQQMCEMCQIGIDARRDRARQRESTKERDKEGENKSLGEQAEATKSGAWVRDQIREPKIGSQDVVIVETHAAKR